MFRSVFLRRIIFMMVISLLASAVVTSAMFYFFSFRALRTDRETEMQTRAGSIAKVYGDSLASDSQDELLPDVLTNVAINDSYVLVYGEDDALLYESDEISDVDLEMFEIAKNYVASDMLSASSESYVSRIISSGDDSEKDIIIVQAPIMQDGTVIGYVVLSATTNELMTTLFDLAKVLFLATLLVAGIMLIPICIVSARIVSPLQKVNNVASAMGQGDFTLRADTRAKGEIGELAKSFNDLADKLSISISELTVERNRLREIFDVISEGIVSVDLELKPLYSNPAISTLFENAKKRNLFTERLQLIPFEEVWDDFKKCIAERTTLERTLESRDSAFLSTIVPTFDNTGTVAGATGFFRDITESERLEQTRRDYVANVSHELRTPLTALRGLVEPLADGMVKNETDRMRYYGIILHETMRLSRLIDDMLELSRLQARTLAFKTFPFDLNATLNELQAKFTPIMSDSSLTFLIEYKDGPCPTVMGNPDRVEQILVILMDNAKKYTPPGGSITISTQLSEKKDQVLVSVIDTGQGIHEYDIDHIFDRFYKADRARGKKGTGLGLSIARELLNYMGEKIEVQSEYGEGTTFTFTLKCVQGTVWY